MLSGCLRSLPMITWFIVCSFDTNETKAYFKLSSSKNDILDIDRQSKTSSLIQQEIDPFV